MVLSGSDEEFESINAEDTEELSMEETIDMEPSINPDPEGVDFIETPVAENVTFESDDVQESLAELSKENPPMPLEVLEKPLKPRASTDEYDTSAIVIAAFVGALVLVVASLAICMLVRRMQHHSYYNDTINRSSTMEIEMCPVDNSNCIVTTPQLDSEWGAITESISLGQMKTPQMWEPDAEQGPPPCDPEPEEYPAENDIHQNWSMAVFPSLSTNTIIVPYPEKHGLESPDRYRSERHIGSTATRTGKRQTAPRPPSSPSPSRALIVPMKKDVALI